MLIGLEGMCVYVCVRVCVWEGGRGEVYIRRDTVRKQGDRGRDEMSSVLFTWTFELKDVGHGWGRGVYILRL